MALKADAVTNLGADDVFYFGNAIGETGNSTTDFKVNSIDEFGCRENQSTGAEPAAIDDPYDFNRDQRVNATDQIIGATTARRA